ncbi:hypothetical protein ACAX43_12495 [Paraburkholderia sp. IW21]|uniref:hypothetical protein n=1 Tax=Paraburkholderia sp. IW21 TaxID=3242488 RepID=UPI00352128F8
MNIDGRVWLLDHLAQQVQDGAAMEDTQSKMWFSGVAFIPYLALAGLYTWFISGHEKDFWTAAAVLIGGRVVYAVLDSIMSTLAWRTYARKRTTDKMQNLFLESRMPQRDYANETLDAYLYRIENGDEDYPVAVKCTARQLSTLLTQAKHDGLLAGGRVEQAITDAYNRYTRRSSVQNPLGAPV